MIPNPSAHKMNFAEDFRQAMTTAELVTNDQIWGDGRLHRIHIQGDKPGSKNGWYVFFGDGIPSGAFGSWKTGQKGTWCSREPGQLSPAEQEFHRKHMDEALKQRKQEQARIHAETRGKAERIWMVEARKAPPDHPYLRKRGIPPHGLKMGADGRLILPVRDIDGNLHGLQRINDAGEKRFLLGTAKKGNFHLIGKPENMIYLAEGYATAASIHQATGQAVVVAFDAENLKPVAVAIHQKWPDSEIIVCADDDQWTTDNPGITKARAAAAAIGAKMAIPKFKNIDSKPTDFNDLHQLEGLEAVREQVHAAVDSWEEPESIPIDLKPVEQFNFLLVPESLRLWIADIAERC